MHHRIMELFGLEETLKIFWFQLPAMGRDARTPGSWQSCERVPRGAAQEGAELSEVMRSHWKWSNTPAFM